MAAYFGKFLVLILIQYHVTVTTSSGANETFKLAIQSAMAKQCKAWYNGRSSKALPPFEFPKEKSLALLRLSVITPENVGNFYILKKLSSRPSFGIHNIHIDRDKEYFREGWTNFLIECRAIYPVSLIINLPKWFELTIVHEQYRWNEHVKNAYGFVFVVSTVVRHTKSVQTTIPLTVTCMKFSFDPYPPKYESKFEFTFYRNKHGQPLLTHSNTETEKQIWVDLDSDSGTKRVCLPMTPTGEIGNWSYDVLDEPVLDDDDEGYLGMVVNVGILIAILGIIIILLSSVVWFIQDLRKRINSTTTATTGQPLEVSVVEPDVQSTRF